MKIFGLTTSTTNRPTANLIPILRSGGFIQAVMVTKAKLKPFIGNWSIVEMEAWDQEYVNMEVSGHFTFDKI